jgi:hypothetical protein
LKLQIVRICFTQSGEAAALPSNAGSNAATNTVAAP